MVVETADAFLLGVVTWSRSDEYGQGCDAWDNARPFTFNSAVSSELAMVVRSNMM